MLLRHDKLNQSTRHQRNVSSNAIILREKQEDAATVSLFYIVQQILRPTSYFKLHSLILPN